MKLEFDYSNGTPPFKFDGELGGYAVPVELRVLHPNDKARRESLAHYLRILSHLFKGVSNIASSYVNRALVFKEWYGQIEKNFDHVAWNMVSDKNYTVIFDININSITEHMYVADGVTTGKGKQEIKGVQPVWIQDLISPSPENVKENIISSIAVVTEFVEDYKMAWGFKGQNGISIFDKNTNLVDIEEIEEDEYYIFFKLLSLLCSKGYHLGVFFIDCKGFSDNFIKLIIELVKAFYGDAYIFLYNVSPNSQTERKVLSLPCFIK